MYPYFRFNLFKFIRNCGYFCNILFSSYLVLQLHTKEILNATVILYLYKL